MAMSSGLRRPAAFVSGTMGLDRQGVPGATLEEQLELIWSHRRAILGTAGMSVDNTLKVTSYLTDASFADANAQARTESLGGRLVPTTAIVIQTLESGWSRLRSSQPANPASETVGPNRSDG
jgi:enamine deaminase RidA (YjgF/YER057c/UK114 family)